MKNNKIVIIGLMGLIFGVFSQVEAVPNFDILNKTDDIIHVKVSGPTSKVLLQGAVRPMGGRLIFANHLSQTINSKFPLTIYIKYGQGAKFDRSYEITSSNPDATVYVTFGKKDGQLRLYPQTGIAGGVLGRTEAGYALDKNRDIRVTEMSKERI